MRKISLLLCLCLVVICFTGCEASQKNLLDKIIPLFSWEYIDMTCSGNFQMNGLEEEKVADTFNFNTYINLKDEEASVFGKIDSKDEDSRQIESYIKDKVMYQNKSEYLAQYPHSQYDKINSEYIGVYMPESVESDFLQIKTYQKFMAEVMSILAEEEVNCPIVVQENAYEINLNDEALSQLIKSLLKAGYHQREALLDLWTRSNENTVVSEEEKALIAQIEEYAKDEDFFEMAYYFIKGTVYGSNCKLRLSFNKDQIELHFVGKLAFVNSSEANLDLKVQLKESTRKSIKLPISSRILSQDEEWYYGSNDLYRTFHEGATYGNSILEKNEELYFSLEQLGYTVGGTNASSDLYLVPETGIAYAKLMKGIKDGKLENKLNSPYVPQVGCKLLSENGTYYISEKELLRLGFQVVESDEEGMEERTLYVYYNIGIDYLLSEEYYDSFAAYYAYQFE